MKIVMINILDFNIFKHNRCISKVVKVLKEEKGIEVKSKIEYYFIELPKVKYLEKGKL